MKYTIKKIGTLVITLLLVSFFTFAAFQIIPGDSATAALGTEATEEAIEAMREEMGYNDPFLIRYGRWVTGILKGDLGTSYRFHMPVNELLQGRLSVTVWLAVLAILMTVIVSVPIGLLSANLKYPKLNKCIQIFSQISMAIPSFFLGMMITLVFGLIFKWFRPGGYVSPEVDFYAFLSFLIFPALAMAIPKTAMMIQFLRSSCTRQLKLDYVRTARSKGMNEVRLLFRHVLKNALIPVITFLGMAIADLLAGSIIIEQVFNLPGVGRLLVTGISNRDYPVVQVIVLYMAAVVIVINFIVDILYQYIDPRIRVS